MANFISIFRTVLAILVVSLLFIERAGVYWLCFTLTLVVIFMDMLDGYVARKRGEASKLGAVVDILGDRIVENIYWISFLALGWLPLFVPLIVIIRGIITDGLRSLSFQYGHTPFGEKTMMKSILGRIIVSSHPSRFIYAVLKAAAFALLILAHVPEWQSALQSLVWKVGYVCAYGAVIVCVLRGLPVIIESRHYLR